MSKTFKALLADYHYNLPAEQIALQPARPRDSARLLVYDRLTKQTTEDYFLNLSAHLPPGALLIFNNTKVLPARLQVIKPTGGKVRLLYLSSRKSNLLFLADRNLAVGSRLRLSSQFYFTVLKRRQEVYYLRPSFPVKRIFTILQRYGLTPLPPYLKHSSLKEVARRRNYQTVFAKYLGSVAAPTASLHFTNRLLKKIRQAGYQTAFVTLHVNLGTFAPLTIKQVKASRLHQEYFFVPKATQAAIKRAKRRGHPVIAVGTTVVRTLESAYGSKGLGLEQGKTSLFIKPGYHFKVVNGLITNFHVPSSSLMMLVAALTGRRRLLALYHRAQQRGFRFFSFGDGMLIK